MNKQIILFASIVLAFVAHGAFAESPFLEQLEETAIRAAVQRAKSAVVRIDLVGASASAGELDASGPTSGLIVSQDGYVLTSAFAFATAPASILVTLDDHRQFPAILVSTDHSRHLVLLKIEGVSDLKPAKVLPRTELAVGQWAIAVGRVLASEHPNVSVGIISALSRIQSRAIQTDAAVSPLNYGGPLIDISGKVIGILTPLSPEQNEGISGTDWYDSGIGFAIPLADYQPGLTRLKAGEDLYRGLLGIVLESGIDIESPPVIASVRARGPAARADLRTGDRIVALDGRTVTSKAALSRVLGCFYAGDSVTLTVERDKSQFDLSAKLVRELEPLRHSALGIRLQGSTDENSSGIPVRNLEPGGPASKAGIEIGDRIDQVGDLPVNSIEELSEAVGTRAPGDVVQLNIVRAEKTLQISVTLGERSSEIYPIEDLKTVDEPLGVKRDFKIPEFANFCPIYLPSNGMDTNTLGLLVLLQSGKEPIDPETIRRWQLAAEKHRVLLAIPSPREARGWSGDDVEYVKQLMRTLIERYQIDRRRVALVGTEVSNRVTLAMWLANRELIRGTVFASADMPQRLQVPENESQQPSLLLFQAAGSDRQTAKTLKQFSDRGFSPATCADANPDVLAAWVDSLDRL